MATDPIAATIPRSVQVPPAGPPSATGFPILLQTLLAGLPPAEAPAATPPPVPSAPTVPSATTVVAMPAVPATSTPAKRPSAKSAPNADPAPPTAPLPTAPLPTAMQPDAPLPAAMQPPIQPSLPIPPSATEPPVLPPAAPAPATPVPATTPATASAASLAHPVPSSAAASADPVASPVAPIFSVTPIFSVDPTLSLAAKTFPSIDRPAPAPQSSAELSPPTTQLSRHLAAWSATTPGGTAQLTLRLDPIELGRLDLTIQQPKDGPASVILLVERPETLLLLQRDESQLNHALTRAGIPEADRQVTIALAPPPPVPPAPAGHAAGQHQDQASGFGPDSRGQHHAPRDESSRRGAPSGGGFIALAIDPPFAQARSLALGVDITA